MSNVQDGLLKGEWIRETGFGRWFLQSGVWVRYVLTVAIHDFAGLLKPKQLKVRRLLDAGCGQGLAFSILEDKLNPELIVGVDIDLELLGLAQEPASACECEVSLVNAKMSALDFPDGYFDMVFCHQLLHHTAHQEAALNELYRVLSPSGVLLVGESCQSFIKTLPVQMLFNHPNKSQKTAQGYIDLVKSCGFIVQEKETKLSAPWWSLPELGLFKKIGLSKKGGVEPTEVLFLAHKSQAF